MKYTVVVAGIIAVLLFVVWWNTSSENMFNFNGNNDFQYVAWYEPQAGTTYASIQQAINSVKAYKGRNQLISVEVGSRDGKTRFDLELLKPGAGTDRYGKASHDFAILTAPNKNRTDASIIRGLKAHFKNERGPGGGSVKITRNSWGVRS